MVVIVVALDDCTISVMKAPQNVLDNGVAAALLSVVRSPEPANALRPLVMTLMPSRNRPTPPRIAIVVDIRPSIAVGAVYDRAQSHNSRSRGHRPRLQPAMSRGPVPCALSPVPSFSPRPPSGM